MDDAQLGYNERIVNEEFFGVRNIPVCTAGKLYDSPTASDVACAPSTSKVCLDATSKEGSSDARMSPNFVDTIIKGETMFHEQLADLCEEQSLEIEEEKIVSRVDDKTEDLGNQSEDHKLLVKDEVLAAIRDDLADEYQPLFRDNMTRISEERRKYLAEKVANATADAAAAADRHWRLSNTKMTM